MSLKTTKSASLIKSLRITNSTMCKLFEKALNNKVNEIQRLRSQLNESMDRDSCLNDEKA